MLIVLLAAVLSLSSCSLFGSSGKTTWRGTVGQGEVRLATQSLTQDTSDVDFLVTFRPGRENLFHDYFDLKFELERIIGRRVDLVMERSVKNPFFKALAFGETQTSMRPEVGAHLWNAAETARLVQEFADGMTEAHFISDLLIRSPIERRFGDSRRGSGEAEQAERSGSIHIRLVRATAVLNEPS